MADIRLYLKADLKQKRNALFGHQRRVEGWAKLTSYDGRSLTLSIRYCSPGKPLPPNSLRKNPTMLTRLKQLSYKPA